MAQQIKVSLNKIAEFACSTSSHRRQMIVKQHKNPPVGKFAAVGYREAENFLPTWLSMQLSPHHLQQRYDSLIQLQTSLQGASSTSGHVKGINNGINALSWLMAMMPLPLPDGAVIEPCDQFAVDGLLYGNVLVKARPNAIIVKPKKGNSQLKAGALKFHFSKGTVLSDQAGDIAAVALYEYLNHTSITSAPAHHSLCYSIDACRSSVRTAPANHIKLHQELVAACHEYEAIWHSI